MDISYETEKLQTLLNSSKAMTKKYGAGNARKMRSRLDDLEAASCLDEMRYLPGRTHELQGKRADTLAIDLHKGLRMIFEPEEKPPPRKPDDGLDWVKIETIRILNVEDYHD